MRKDRLFIKLISIGMAGLLACAYPAPKASKASAEEGTTVSDTTQVSEVTASDEQSEQTEVQDTSEGQTEEKTAEQLKQEAEEAKLALQNDPNHVHNFEWVAFVNQESESADGVIKYMCLECGKVWYFRPIPAYDAFQGDAVRKIRTAAEGETVQIKTSHFIHFKHEVMEALAQRPDVSVYVSFLDQEYKGNRLSFVIPAGEDVISLVDENGYAGFLYLGEKYGLKLEEAMFIPEPEVTSEDADEQGENQDVAKSVLKTVKKTKELTTA